jgi:hypothetical protein
MARTARECALIASGDIAAGPQTRTTVADFARSLLAIDSTKAAPIERRFRVAGFDMSVRFGDPVLADAYASRFMPQDGTGTAVDHRLVVIHAADIDWPLVPEWTDESCSPRRFHSLLAAQGLRVAYPFSPRIWQVYDLVARTGVQLTGSRSDLPPWDFGAPLRQHLHWLLAQHGLRLAHAATLGRNGRGVLIVGNGGVGKSGTTLAGVAAGMTTCGDDYVALGLDGGAVARLLFRVIKQDRHGLSRFAVLKNGTGGLAVNWRQKVELDPEAFFPGCLAERLAIDAVLLPAIAHRETAQIVPISRGEIMRAMMRSNLYQFPGEEDDGLAFFAKFLADLPCFRIDLAFDPTANSNAIERLLQDVRR